MADLANLQTTAEPTTAARPAKSQTGAHKEGWEAIMRDGDARQKVHSVYGGSRKSEKQKLQSNFQKSDSGFYKKHTHQRKPQSVKDEVDRPYAKNI